MMSFIYSRMSELTILHIKLFHQFPVGEQRGSARRRLPHLPVGGEGADETLQGPRLFPSGVLEDGG